MGGSSSSGNTIRTVRFAPYVESKHSSFLDATVGYRNSMIGDSPYANYISVETDDAFLGFGYFISSFPSLYDMFGKHMAGLDIGELWKTVFEKVFGDPNINVSISERMKLIDDKMVKEDLANFQVDMRNLNAISTSSFAIGKAVIENKRIKTLAEISLEIKVGLLDVVGRSYAYFLNWEKLIITVYAEAMKKYFVQTDSANYVNSSYASMNSLWPFTVLSFEGYALAALRGTAAWQKQNLRERSDVSKVLMVASYTATGAIIGSEILPGWGTVIGAIVGVIVGIAMLFLE